MRKQKKQILVLAVITAFIVGGLFLPGLIGAAVEDKIGSLAPAPVEKTGQGESHAKGDDGALKKGVAWPSPRFADNGDGTVTDNLTGLVWLKNANCDGKKMWANALSFCNSITSGSWEELTDGSVAGDWRLPNIKELQSLIDYGQQSPVLPVGHPFVNLQSDWYWSGTTCVHYTGSAWTVRMSYGDVGSGGKVSGKFCVWPVRDGN